MAIKFQKFRIVDDVTKVSARVFYSLDNRVDERKCVTIYAKDYDRKLGQIFSDYQNDTDTMTDYFDQGKVVLFEDHKLYDQARSYVKSIG